MLRAAAQVWVLDVVHEGEVQNSGLCTRSLAAVTALQRLSEATATTTADDACTSRGGGRHGAREVVERRRRGRELRLPVRDLRIARLDGVPRTDESRRWRKAADCHRTPRSAHHEEEFQV